MYTTVCIYNYYLVCVYCIVYVCISVHWFTFSIAIWNCIFALCAHNYIMRTLSHKHEYVHWHCTCWPHSISLCAHIYVVMRYAVCRSLPSAVHEFVRGISVRVWCADAECCKRVLSLGVVVSQWRHATKPWNRQYVIHMFANFICLHYFM